MTADHSQEQSEVEISRMDHSATDLEGMGTYMGDPIPDEMGEDRGARPDQPDSERKVVWVPQTLHGEAGYRAIRDKIVKLGLPPPSEFVLASRGGIHPLGY